MAKSVRYECVRECTYEVPGTGFHRHFQVDDTLEVSEEAKVPEHFRKFKRGLPPPTAKSAELEGFDDNDPINAAMSGKPVALSEISGQTLPPTTGTKK